MKHFFIYVSIFFVLAGCSNDDDVFIVGESDIEIDLPSPEVNSVINERIFDLIDLNYSGLEKAKEYYEKEQYYFAAQYLLEYYKTRTKVVNPNLSLMNVSVTADDWSKADYALDDYRFFVNNYYEDATDKKPYSLKKNGTIDWTFKPIDADDEYQKQLHRHQWFVPQARVYRASNNEKYIKSWIEVYTNWLKQNPMPDNGTNNTTWWQLQVAERIYGQVELFDYYKHSVNFTPQWFSTFMTNFADHADFLVKYPYSDGNILISQAAALAFAGVLFPEFKNAETWMNTGYKILNEEVKSQFLDDGMHIELDFSYHISAIADFYEAMKLADANGLSQKLPDGFKESLRSATELVMHFTYPLFFNSKSSGYYVPGFNDTRQKSWTRSVLIKNFKRYIEMFSDHQELLYMATSGAQGTQPNIQPKLFDKGGYYILRNGWLPASTMFIHSNNYDYNNNSLKIWSHNQPDNGTFELYHNGRNFFPDTGVFAYYNSSGSNTDRLWYRQTKVHNTLTLNGKDITTAQGELLKSSVEGNTDVIVTQNQGYSNLKHRRYIFFVNKQFFVLVDEGIGNASGVMNLNFNLCEGTDTEVIVDEGDNGARTAFADGNNIIVRSFGNNILSTEPFAGKVSYALTETAARKGYSINSTKASAETARFITVIYPVAGSTSDTTIAASFNEAAYNDKGVSFEVIVNGTAYVLNYSL